MFPVPADRSWFDRLTTNRNHPFFLSLSKEVCRRMFPVPADRSWFDRLTMNGGKLTTNRNHPFTLSLSKGACRRKSAEGKAPPHGHKKCTHPTLCWIGPHSGKSSRRYLTCAWRRNPFPHRLYWITIENRSGPDTDKLDEFTELSYRLRPTRHTKAVLLLIKRPQKGFRSA